jgi:hypothetical protein
MFSIQTLKSLLDSPIAGGPASAAHYTTLISPPKAMGAAGFLATVPLSIITESAQFPGRQFVTTDHTMYGTRVKMPYGVAYDDLTLTFISTNNFLERLFFDEWQRIISDPGNNFFNYYDDYVANIQVIKLRPDYTPLGTPTYFVTIEEAYPIALQAQELTYESDSYMKLSVTFAYRRWRNLWDLASGGSSGVAGGAPEGFGGLSDPFGLNRTTQGVKPD